MPRAGLTPDLVIDIAAALADERGMRAVTLAAIADRAGVKPPSLYKHIDGLDAIERALALRGLREVNVRTVRAIIGLSGEPALVAMAKSCWRFSQEHPGLYQAMLRASHPHDPELDEARGILVGIVAAILDGFGLGGNDATHAVRGFRAIVHGFISLHAAKAFGVASGVEDSLVQLVRSFASSLAAEAAAVRPRRVALGGR